MISDKERPEERWAASAVALLLCITALCAVAWPLGEWLTGHGGVVALLVFVIFLAWWGEDWHAWMTERQHRARENTAR
jgi:uncharacterized membrane protein